MEMKQTLKQKQRALCPRCEKNELEDGHTALSRRDNHTKICPPCGQDEAMIDAGFHIPDRKEMRLLTKIGRRRVFFLLESEKTMTGAYKVLQCTENEPGYYITSRTSSADRETAEKEVKRLNKWTGLSEMEVERIQLSSMFAQKKGGE